MVVLKRNGKKVDFDKQKIKIAINKAYFEVYAKDAPFSGEIADEIEKAVRVEGDDIDVEDIQDMVEDMLMEEDRMVAKAYIRYRYKRKLARNTTDNTIMEYLSGSNEYWNNENSNKDAKVVTTQRDYLAGITSTDIARRIILPQEVVEAHDKGIIHQHDMDYLAQSALSNCCLINLEDMLLNGTVINGVTIEPQHRLSTAVTVTTQLITAVASSQYGGCTISLTHLAPFVRMSYSAACEKYKQRGETQEKIEKYAMEDLKREIKDAVQTFNYQVNSMSTTNGQAPFLSVFMWAHENPEYEKETVMLIEEFLHQRIKGMKNEVGVYITPAFPKLLYLLDENNSNENSPYWWLTTLAAECTAKRMVPDYISAKIMKELKINRFGNGDVYPCMGCRSFLTPDTCTENYAKAKNYKPNEGKYYGRFNTGVTTLNLPYIALMAGGDIEQFWKLLDKYCEICHKGLQTRINRLENVTSDVAPILWQHGALARLDKGEKLHNLLHNNYSTASLGYAGLWETVKALTGEKLTSKHGQELGLRVLQFLNDKCAKWREEENIGYSVYGTPLESTSYKFAKALKRDFGEIIGISDKDYITNSYHIHVTEEIDIFNKLKFESTFQKLSPGGAISYGEVPNLTKNIPSVLEVIKFIYNNIMYAELNTKSDYCQVCGYDGEIEIVKKPDGKLDWRCPQCGNMDHKKMNVVRRTCGYLGSNFWNQGRTQEIAERKLHL